MLELIIALVIAVVLWNLRTAFYNQSEIWKDKVSLSTSDSKLDLQDDIVDLHKRIVDKKATQDGKWYGIKDIDELMK